MLLCSVVLTLYEAEHRQHEQTNIYLSTDQLQDFKGACSEICGKMNFS